MSEGQGSTAAQAVITGASAGIGEALARTLAGAGWDLVLVARRQERLEALASELRQQHGREVIALGLDVCDPSAPDAILAAAPRLEVLVNNAGAGKFGPVLGQPVEEQTAQVRLNCESLTRLSLALLPALVSRGKGVIVNLASIAGFQPTPYFTVYAATKAYVLSFSQALDAEVSARGVRVVAVCPGPVPTEFQGLAGSPDARHSPAMWRRTPEQVAESCLQAIQRPRRVVTPAPVHGWVRWCYRFLPESTVVGMAGKSMRKRTDG